MTDDIKPVLTEQDIEDIIMTGGHSNVAGGIYATSVYAFAKEVAIAAVLADREGRQQWISVDDRLPENDELVLVLTPAGRYQKVGLDCWRMQREAPLGWSSATIETGMGWDDHEAEEVTHWMPLPAPPADAQRAKEPT